MKTKVRYFIAYYGYKHMWWCDEQEMFVPVGMYLYRTTWDKLEDAMQAMRRVRKIASGWVDDIYIDSELTC